MRLFVVKLSSADDFPNLYAEYCRLTGDESLYEHDFMKQIMFQTTGNGQSANTYIQYFLCWWGCVADAVIRCEDAWPYLSGNCGGESKKLFEQFFRGLFGLEDESIKIGSPASLAHAFRSRNWRAIEFLLGENGFIDATFPLPHEKSSFDWKRG